MAKIKLVVSATISITSDDVLCGSAAYSPAGMHHCNNSGNSGRTLHRKRV